MERIFKKLKYSVKHLEALHQGFKKGANFSDEEQLNHDIYLQNANKFKQLADELGIPEQLYGQKERQMILADLVEYIFIGRGYYSIRNREDKSKFIKLVLHLVNLLMSYESITASDNLRRQVLNNLSVRIPQISNEELFGELINHSGTVGLPEKVSDAPKVLNKYFDSILPKTAGGLWHELLVFIFMLRNNIGYIIPLLLTQRLIGLERNIIPPDFLLITYDKHLYGVEVGTKKEIQSGSFSLQTSIPTATIDTVNSRSSDRCPICKKWIPFCYYAIEQFADLDHPIDKKEIRCLKDCDKYSCEEIAAGQCPFTKYSRKKTKTYPYTHHDFSDAKHYHYQCVLSHVPEETRNIIIQANDTAALKTHYPYYSGLEELIQKEP